MRIAKTDRETDIRHLSVQENKMPVSTAELMKKSLANGSSDQADFDLTQYGITVTSAPTERDPVFGFELPTACPGVPSEILIPKNTWVSKPNYDETAKRLAGLFRDNFAKYSEGATAEVRVAGPAA